MQAWDEYDVLMEMHAAAVEQLGHDWYRETDEIKQALLAHSPDRMPTD